MYNNCKNKKKNPWDIIESGLSIKRIIILIEMYGTVLFLFLLSPLPESKVQFQHHIFPSIKKNSRMKDRKKTTTT